MITAYQRAIDASVLLNASPRVMLAAACPRVVIDSPSIVARYVVTGNMMRAEAMRMMMGRSMSMTFAFPALPLVTISTSPGASPKAGLKSLPSSARRWLLFMGPKSLFVRMIVTTMMSVSIA